jgi:hypothetical protein
MSLARLFMTDELLSIFSIMFDFRDQCSSFFRLVYRLSFARMIIVVFILFSKLEFFLRILSLRLNFFHKIVEMLVSQNNRDASDSIRNRFVYRSREKNKEKWYLSLKLILVIFREAHDMMIYREISYIFLKQLNDFFRLYYRSLNISSSY